MAQKVRMHTLNIKMTPQAQVLEHLVPTGSAVLGQVVETSGGKALVEGEGHGWAWCPWTQ